MLMSSKHGVVLGVSCSFIQNALSSVADWGDLLIVKLLNWKKLCFSWTEFIEHIIFMYVLISKFTAMSGYCEKKKKTTQASVKDVDKNTVVS